MSPDPSDRQIAVEAELATIVFESQEKDRWLRANSFLYRRGGWFIGLSMLLIIGAMSAMFIEGYNPDATWHISLYLMMGWSGIIVMFATIFRSDTKSGFGAVMKTLIVLTIFAIVVIPLYIGLLAFIGWVLE